MNQPRVLCLGEVLYDFLAGQPGLPLEEVKSWTPYPGGAPANVACGLAKLGTPAGFIGCVGQDDLGGLVELMQTIGVDSTGIQRHPTAPTRAVYVVRSLTGDRNDWFFGWKPQQELWNGRLAMIGFVAYRYGIGLATAFFAMSCI